MLSVTFDIMEEIKQAYSLAEKAGVKDLRIDIHVLGDFKCIPCADIPNSFKGMCYIAFVYFDKNGKEFTIIDKMEKGICVGAEMIEIGKNLW